MNEIFYKIVPTSIPLRLRTVTTLSRSIALVLFILLPFIGGWVGYVSAPEKIVQVEKFTQVDDETYNEIDEITKQYQSTYDTEKILEVLYRPESGEDIVYFKSIGYTSACCHVIGYNQASKTFFETDLYADAILGERFSPSGQFIAKISEYNEAEPYKLEIFDLESKSVVKTIVLEEGESFVEGHCGYGGSYVNLTWLNYNTINYGVYKNIPQDSQSCSPEVTPEFIEYRYQEVM